MILFFLLESQFGGYLRGNTCLLFFVLLRSSSLFLFCFLQHFHLDRFNFVFIVPILNLEVFSFFFQSTQVSHLTSESVHLLLRVLVSNRLLSKGRFISPQRLLDLGEGIVRIVFAKQLQCLPEYVRLSNQCVRLSKEDCNLRELLHDSIHLCLKELDSFVVINILFGWLSSFELLTEFMLDMPWSEG